MCTCGDISLRWVDMTRLGKSSTLHSCRDIFALHTTVFVSSYYCKWVFIQLYTQVCHHRLLLRIRRFNVWVREGMSAHLYKDMLLKREGLSTDWVFAVFALNLDAWWGSLFLSPHKHNIYIYIHIYILLSMCESLDMDEIREVFCMCHAFRFWRCSLKVFSGPSLITMTT